VARDFARRRERLAPLGLRLDRAQARALAAERDRLARVSARLQPALVARGVLQRRERLVPATRRLAEARQRLVGDRRTRLEALARLLGSLSYKGTLARGFAVVRDGTGHVLTAKAEAQTAGALEIEFVDGRLRIGGAAPPKRAREETPEQGRLL
jgi:exodeoxyribonuclease VII large subunit